MKRWMLDFDGVLANLSDAMIRACNDRFGTDYQPGDETGWHWWNDQPKEHADYVWRVCYPDRDWLLGEVVPYPGVAGAIREIVDGGDYAAIVTARKESHHEAISAWMDKHGIDIPLYCVGSSPKSAMCARLRLDIVVEDGVHNLLRMNPNMQKLFLVDRPWNAGQLVLGAHRVSGLPQAVEVMR